MEEIRTMKYPQKRDIEMCVSIYIERGGGGQRDHVLWYPTKMIVACPLVFDTYRWVKLLSN